MTALADALTAAQHRAVAAIQKQYAAGKIEAETVRERLDLIGLTDTVDQDRLLAARLLVVRASCRCGAIAPEEVADDDAA